MNSSEEITSDNKRLRYPFYSHFSVDHILLSEASKVQLFENENTLRLSGESSGRSTIRFKIATSTYLFSFFRLSLFHKNRDKNCWKRKLS